MKDKLEDITKETFQSYLQIYNTVTMAEKERSRLSYEINNYSYGATVSTIFVGVGIAGVILSGGVFFTALSAVCGSMAAYNFFASRTQEKKLAKVNQTLVQLKTSQEYTDLSKILN